LIKLDIGGLGDLKLIFGIRVLGTTFRAKRENKVIFKNNFLIFSFFLGVYF
jgi:hypothetical protein